MGRACKFLGLPPSFPRFPKESLELEQIFALDLVTRNVYIREQAGQPEGLFLLLGDSLYLVYLFTRQHLFVFCFFLCNSLCIV